MHIMGLRNVTCLPFSCITSKYYSSSIQFNSILKFYSRYLKRNKKFTQRPELRGDVNRTPLPFSIFKSVQPIDMKLGMCNKCLVYFQLSIVTLHLIGFYGNHSNIMTPLVAAILDFQIFDFFHIQIKTLKIVRKQHLAIGIYKII